ncbi:MAG: hypothetical protein L0213_07165, partial [Candidatus Dadabacteria bacterium]|nr:hypothetical protein [Candidatus Dadabacteria bacterium]
EQPGQENKIKVDTTRGGVELRYRPVHVAPKAYKEMTPEERDSHLKETSTSRALYGDMPLWSGAFFFPAGGEKTLALVSFRLDGKDIFAPSGEGFADSNLELSCLAYTPGGQLFEAFHKRVTVFAPPAGSDITRIKFQYYEYMTLPPGYYTLRTYARVKASGLLASDERRVAVPAYQAGKGGIGSLIPVEREEDILAVSEYITQGKDGAAKVDRDSPLYSKEGVIVPELEPAYSDINPAMEILLVLSGADREEIEAGNLPSFFLETKDTDPERISPKPVEIIDHRDGSLAVRYSYNLTGYVEGDYTLSAIFRDAEGRQTRSELNFKVKGE